ncbi:MAG: 3-deoxy-8-phosphooctulonate synthase [Verrucomicrobiota bacterium]|nr:3-deoxy-8-phosphooctulonate synthase [Verrucomicrobiota bacterium]
MVRSVNIGSLKLGRGRPLALIAGPCVIESRQACLDLASRLVGLARRENIPLIFKASYDKANRSSIRSYRGPGMAKGLAILAEVRQRFRVPVLTDVHSEAEVGPVSEVADVLQIPAFLCRQTDLLVAAGETGCAVNVKKGQFLAPGDMRHVVEKIETTGNRNILLTERGVTFGYNNLIADMRSLLILRELGYPVIFDATHSVQRPGAGAVSSGGDGRWAPALARAAVATGCDGVFMETHPHPAKALSDPENCVALSDIRPVWRTLKRIHEAVR